MVDVLEHEKREKKKQGENREVELVLPGCFKFEMDGRLAAAKRRSLH